MPELQIQTLSDAVGLIGEFVAEYDRLNVNEKGRAFLHPYDPGQYPYHIWFRGEPDEPSTQLQPAVFRPNRNGTSHFDETSMFTYARGRYPQLNTPSPGVLPSLCRMQHHRVPTRLLDWTESLGVALYFAVCDHPDKDAWLFCLNGRKLNRITGMLADDEWRNIHNEDDFGTLFRCAFVTSNARKDWFRKISYHAEFNWRADDVAAKVTSEPCYQETKVPEAACDFHASPVALLPRQEDLRALEQRSVFTLHGGKLVPNSDESDLPYPKTLTKLNEQLDVTRRFLKGWRIPAAAKRRLRFDLHGLGIHEAVLFPDSDAVGRALQEMFS